MVSFFVRSSIVFKNGHGNVGFFLSLHCYNAAVQISGYIISMSRVEEMFFKNSIIIMLLNSSEAPCIVLDM